MYSYSSNTVQRTEWYAKLITTPFPINCEAVGFTVLYSCTTVHIVYFVVRYIPGTVVKYSGVYWSTPGSTSYEYSTMYSYSSNTVQRTEWYAKLITTPFPINCEAPTSILKT